MGCFVKIIMHKVKMEAMAQNEQWPFPPLLSENKLDLVSLEGLNPLPDDKILDWSKLKNKLHADDMLKCI